MNQPNPHAVIIGAGLAGSLLACYLARDGWRVSVYERRADPRRAGYGGGRSINLALSARGFSGLAGVGLDDRVRQRDAIRMPGRMIHPVSGPLVFQPYSSDPGDAINSVSRGGLNLTLLAAASERPNVAFHFECTCVDIEPDGPVAIVRAGAGTEHIACDLLIGADGAFSAVRGRLQREGRFDYSQSYLDHGYKELHIPPAAALGLDPAEFGGYAMDPHALHIWPRGGAMMIALPNRDTSFTCTLFWPFRGPHGLEQLDTGGRVESFFAQHYPDAAPLMPTLAKDYLGNPTGTLVTIRCHPWQHAGRVCLIGDAAHAIVPFYGQGMNAAFEDVRDLAALLARHGRDRGSALQEFEAVRRPSADAIADMALENFIEMRDRVGDPVFRYRKRVEQTLHRLLPDRVTPQYNLVSFSTVPYEEARRRGRELDSVVAHVTAALPMGSPESLGDGAWERRVAALGAAALAQRGAGPDPGGPAIDITPPVTPRLAVWPGDTPLSREVLCDLDRGDGITLSTIRATVHLGAHADGPNHYGRGAPGIGERSLHHYIGRCRVVEARIGRGQRVRPTDLAGGIDPITEPRVLLRTGTFPDPESWNEDFAGLSVELIEALSARGVITIGIDTPSVDLFSSKDLPAHRAILAGDIAIIEGLVLSAVEPGIYELAALPLRLMGFDASPVRAVLRRVPGHPTGNLAVQVRDNGAPRARPS
ncbi:MAG: FAD-dependent monooxygenase [Phycisphaerales bacterium]|nr:FAD-dependent monooxygenase [Phycisphaerales bacterium]